MFTLNLVGRVYFRKVLIKNKEKKRHVNKARQRQQSFVCVRAFLF